MPVESRTQQALRIFPDIDGRRTAELGVVVPIVLCHVEHHDMFAVLYVLVIVRAIEIGVPEVRGVDGLILESPWLANHAVFVFVDDVRVPVEEMCRRMLSAAHYLQITAVLSCPDDFREELRVVPRRVRIGGSGAATQTALRRRSTRSLARYRNARETCAGRFGCPIRRRNRDPVAGAEAASYAGAPPGARPAAERVDADEHRPRLSDVRRSERVAPRRRLRGPVAGVASQGERVRP